MRNFRKTFINIGRFWEYMAPLKEELEKIGRILLEKIPKHLNGKECVLWMKENGKQWKQMEWPGFFFDEFGVKSLIEKYKGEKGPSVGNTIFDYQNDFVCDLKFHSLNDKNNNRNSWAILNDLEAIKRIIADYHGIGFAIGLGTAEYDFDRSFQKWHDALKGSPSDYVQKKRAENANSRLRKQSCEFESIKILFFNSMDDITRGLKEGWIAVFQKGMKNSNDNPRRGKIMINIDRVPKEFIKFEGAKTNS